MAKFAATVLATASKRNLRPADLSKISGLDKGNLSRILRGGVTTTTAARSLISCFEPDDRRELARAYANDVLTELGLDSSELTFKSGAADRLRDEVDAELYELLSDLGRKANSGEAPALRNMLRELRATLSPDSHLPKRTEILATLRTQKAPVWKKTLGKKAG